MLSKKTILPIVFFTFLLIPMVYAKTSLSILYSVFNSPIPQYYQTDKPYKTFECKITINAEFNTTNAGAVICIGLFNNNTVSKKGILLKIFQYPADILYCDGSSSTVIASVSGAMGGWRNSIGNTWIISYDGKRLFIGNSTNRNIALNGFYIGDWVLNYIQASDSTHYCPRSLINGFVYVEVSGAVMDYTKIVYDFLPVILMLAFIGVCVGLIKRYSK